jgi:PKD repeat protein
MKKFTPFLLLVLALSIGSMLCAQPSYKVHFAHGTETFEVNFKTEKNKTIPATDITQGYFARYVQFNTLPSTEQRKALESKGVIWNGYVNYGTYLMLFPEKFDFSTLDALDARSIVAPQPRWKMHRNLVERPFGKWARHGDFIDICVQLYPHTSIEQGATYFEQKKIQILQKGNQNGFLSIRVELDKIEEIAALPLVKWMELMPEPAVKDDINGRSLHRSNVLDSDHPLGKKYNGAGVNVLVRDDGAVGPHIDFQGRLFNQDGSDAQLAGTHGDGVAGIIGGAGNIDPTKKGMAAGADIFVVDYVNNFQDATLPLYLDKNVTITNSSYSDGCNAGYTLATQTVDEQIYQHPYLMHVFSAGNSNGSDCDYGAGGQWGNITGGHKMAKNAIATANLRVDGAIEPSSSRGPAHDGRLKPDISAHGAEQNSTDPNNEYQVFGGTSAAAPGIAGCLTQLTQAYRTLNNTPDAPAALLKLAIMNTANEMGNIGPDYIFGWGHVNNFRALNLLESNRYTSGSVENGATTTHTVAIPSQTRQAKLMVYWVDRPSDENTARALINDLDITVTAPNGTIYRPWLLDPTPNATNLNTPATTGRDSLNNVEQVAIENPVAGTYTVNIKGFEVPFGPQPYYLAWEFLNDRVQLTYPAGGEGFIPGTKEWLRWDAYGNTETFTLRYSLDGGNSFLPIIGSINNAQRMYEWTVPNTTSGNVKLMLIRGARRDTTDFPLTIAPLPTNLAVAKVCPDSITLSWTKTANDTIAYDIYTLGEKYMELTGTTPLAAQQYTIPIIDAAEESWYSIRSSKSSAGIVGRRTLAVNWPGGLLSCPQQFDAAVLNLISPAGNAIVGCGATSRPVTVEVTNQGINAISGATISYSIDGQTPVTENLPDIAPNDTLTFTFATPISFTTNGQLSLEVSVNLMGDNFTSNNNRTRLYTVVAESTNSAFSVGFDDTPVLPNGWNIINEDDLVGWAVTPNNVIGSDNIATKALFLNHFSYNPAEQQEDYLYMIPLDLSTLQYPTLVFDYAHTLYDNNYTDGLKIEAYPNCDLGATPVVIWEKTDPDLATAPAQTTSFFPTTAAQWSQQAVSLSQFIGQSVVLRFTSINGFGNNTFLDNVGLKNVIPTFPIAQFSAPDTICRADTISVVAAPSPGSDDVYAWNFGSTAQPTTASGPGPHTVIYPLPGNRTIRLIVSNGFGKDTLSETVVVRGFPTAVFSQVLNGLTVNFTNNSANADSFLWEFGDGNTSTEKNPSHTYTTAGTYTVTLRSINNCRETVKTTTITLTSGTVEQTGLNKVQILPNPNSGQFQVAITNTNDPLDIRLQLFDATGRLVKEQIPGLIGQETRIIAFDDLRLPAGNYQLSIQTAKGSVAFVVVVQ